MQPVAEVDVLVVERDDVIRDECGHLGERPPFDGLWGDAHSDLSVTRKVENLIPDKLACTCKIWTQFLQESLGALNNHPLRGEFAIGRKES